MQVLAAVWSVPVCSMTMSPWLIFSAALRVSRHTASFYREKLLDLLLIIFHLFSRRELGASIFLILWIWSESSILRLSRNRFCRFKCGDTPPDYEDFVRRFHVSAA